MADQQELSDRCLDLTNYLEKCVIGLVLENTRINSQQQRLRIRMLRLASCKFFFVRYSN